MIGSGLLASLMIGIAFAIAANLLFKNLSAQAEEKRQKFIVIALHGSLMGIWYGALIVLSGFAIGNILMIGFAGLLGFALGMAHKLRT